MLRDIVVTTGDLKCDYEIIGPIYFQVSNKGLFSSALSKLVNKYRDQIAQMKREGRMSPDQTDWGFLYGGMERGAERLRKSLFVAVEELKERAAMLGADAIIGLRQDIDLDTNGFQFFYLQMYGTAVKRK